VPVLLVELRTPLPVRVGVEGVARSKDREDDLGVMVSDGIAVAGRTGRPDELLGLLVWPKIVIFESLVVERVASDDGLLNTEGKSLDLLGDGEAFPFCCSA
jgi:hypothetical protein